MKKAVVFHGTDNKLTDHWLPWMISDLRMRGFEVFAPELPNNHNPNKETYDNFLRQSDWDFKDNLLIGFSSGSTTVLNLLSSDWLPNVSTVVLVGTFLNLRLVETADWYEQGQFDHLFLDSYDPELIKQKAKSFYFVHGSDDPYCDIDDAREFCKKIGGKFIEIPNGHHLADSSGRKSLPELMEMLEKDDIL